MAEYKPTTGGNPATWAKPIFNGMISAAKVIPAVASRGTSAQPIPRMPTNGWGQRVVRVFSMSSVRVREVPPPPFGKHHSVGSEVVSPRTPRVLPAILHPLSVEDVVGVVNLVPFHPVDDVGDVRETGFDKLVDCQRTATSGSARDQDRVGGLGDLLHLGNEIGVGLHRELSLAGVPLIRLENEGYVPCHFRVANSSTV